MSWPRQLPAPLRISQVLKLTASHLDKWAAPRGGTVKVMESMSHLWEEIYLLEDRPRILLCFNGAEPRGGVDKADHLHRDDRRFVCVVLRGHGFNQRDSDVKNPGEERSFTDDVEDIRDQIRILTCISEEFPINYRSIRSLPNPGPTPSANVFLDGYAIDFTTANDIPQIKSGDVVE